MSGIKFSIFELILMVLCQARLDFNSALCNYYLRKFGTAGSVMGVGPTSLSYTGETAFVTGSADVIVNLRYFDSLFNDDKYFGLTQEDGKTADDTCLDLRVFKFLSSSYSDAVQVTDLPFTATSNDQKKWRYLSFTIKQNEFGQRLVQTTNTKNYVYIGYYALAYYAAETTQVQFTFYFQFSVVVARTSGTPVSTAFTPQNQFETVSCTVSAPCNVTPSTKLQWCIDATCSDNTIPVIYLNDQFYIQQVVNITGLTNYYLIDTTVSYVGNGLDIQTKPISIDNSKPGQVLLLLNADIVWSIIYIQVISYLSITQNGARLLYEMKDSIKYDSIKRRLLTTDQIIYDPVSGITQTLVCIKMNANVPTCPTCEEECKVNGFSSKDCDECSGKQQIRLDFNSDACQNYLKKFGTFNSVNGQGPTSLSYQGWTFFDSWESNLIVYLIYSDSLFDDDTYWGLSQEDGKVANATCLDLKLWKFTSISYSDPVHVTDLVFTASIFDFNFQQIRRSLSFTLNERDFNKSLVYTSNSDQYLYTGYYALAYYAAETTQVQYTFYFQFSVTVNKTDENQVSTIFTPFNQYETKGCTPLAACTVTPSTTIKWCTDQTCTDNSVPNLYLNKQFYIQQVITTPGLKNYTLTSGIVSYIGNGLEKETIPIQVDNTKPGQLLLQLTADVAWNNLKIRVISYLTTTNNGTRLLGEEIDQFSQNPETGRLLESVETLLDPVSGTTELITCIKMNSTDIICPQCSDECKVNGFAEGICKCINDKQRLDLYGDACGKYKSKFGKVSALYGNYLTMLSYSGVSEIDQNKSNLTITLSYYDSLFDDATYWGLSQEDGKAANATCLDLVLWKYSSNSYSLEGVEQVTDLPFTASSNPSNKMRYLSFTIKGSEFATRLIKTNNSNNYVYNGYYAITYTDAEAQNNKVYGFFFQFSVTVSKESGTLVTSTFKSLNRLERLCQYPQEACTVNNLTKLSWCTDATCSVNTVPDLYYKDLFYLQIMITHPNLTSFYLTNTTVYYVGNGLNVKTTPVKISNAKPGKALLLLTADIVWNNFTILVTSYLSTTAKGARLLTQSSDSLEYDGKLTFVRQTYDPISGTSEPITCIKFYAFDTKCPTCEEECKANGFAEEGCGVCSNSNNTIVTPNNHKSSIHGSKLLSLIAIILAVII